MTLAGPAIGPTHGAEIPAREGPKPRIRMPAAERWRLRPAETVMPSTTGSIGRRSATPIPEDRRNVRLVYPPLVETR